MSNHRLSRREFLKSAGVVTCGGLVHRSIFANNSMFAYALPPAVVAAPGPNMVLLVVSLSGGCSYNAVPPYNDKYFDLNRTLAHRPDAAGAINLTAEQGLHPSLTALKPLWDAGNLAVVNLVTFPNYTRAHDRDMDKWFLGLPGNSTVSPSGWAARLTCQMGATFGGVSLAGYNLLIQGECNPPQALVGLDGFSTYPPDPRYSGWTQAARRSLLDSVVPKNESERFVNQQSQILSANARLVGNSLSFNTDERFGVTFPNTMIGQMFEQAGKLLATPSLGTRFIFCEQGGYDTHQNEQSVQSQNLSELNAAISALVTLAKHPQVNRWNDLVIVTMSEFGRTWENASFGTDHGHSGFQIVIGGGVKGGRIVTPAPTAADCAANEHFLRTSHVDNRQVFKECVQAMGFNADQVFPGSAFPSLELF